MGPTIHLRGISFPPFGVSAKACMPFFELFFGARLFICVNEAIISVKYYLI
jgi:hypothetical protein